MDRAEREALAWVNGHLVGHGLPELARFPKSRMLDPGSLPVPRVFSRLLLVADLRSPGDAQFFTTVSHYRYWRALRCMVGRWPDSVIAFNRGCLDGRYPHLNA